MAALLTATKTKALPPARKPSRRQLVDEVRELIAEEFILSGVVPAGEVLPSEVQLAGRYGVSRATVRSSLLSLQHARLIDIRNGIGSVVLPRSRATIEGIEQLLSVEAFARREGRTVESSAVHWDEHSADDVTAERLGVQPGEPVVSIEQLKVMGGKPIARGLDRIPASIISRESLEQTFDGSVLDALEAHEEVNVVSADSEFTALGLPSEIARSLRVKANTPAVFLDQTIRDEKGRIVQWAQTWLLPEYFRLTLHRRTPAPR